MRTWLTAGVECNVDCVLLLGSAVCCGDIDGILEAIQTAEKTSSRRAEPDHNVSISAKKFKTVG